MATDQFLHFFIACAEIGRDEHDIAAATGLISHGRQKKRAQRTQQRIVCLRMSLAVFEGDDQGRLRAWPCIGSRPI